MCAGREASPVSHCAELTVRSHELGVLGVAATSAPLAYSGKSHDDDLHRSHHTRTAHVHKVQRPHGRRRSSHRRAAREDAVARGGAARSYAACAHAGRTRGAGVQGGAGGTCAVPIAPFLTYDAGADADAMWDEGH